MEIVLLENGQGLLRFEVETVATDSVICNFVSDKTPSVLSIIDGNRTVRKRIENGTCTIDLAPFMNSNVRFVASTNQKVWNCGGVRIERTEDGGVRIRSLTDYTEKLKECFLEIKALKESVRGLEKSFDEFRRKGTNKSYKIV